MPSPIIPTFKGKSLWHWGLRHHAQCRNYMSQTRLVIWHFLRAGGPWQLQTQGLGGAAARSQDVDCRYNRQGGLGEAKTTNRLRYFTRKPIINNSTRKPERPQQVPYCRLIHLHPVIQPARSNILTDDGSRVQAHVFLFTWFQVCRRRC